jgi:hypothetical protein
MRLSTVFARFYKSFNYDRIRKAKPGATPRGDWENYQGQWFPYVEVRVDERLTTIVGANESGKSHLLSAIEKAITGDGFARRDLCRYCEFFGVTVEEGCWPHLGVAWSNVTPAEWEDIKSVTGSSGPTSTEFMMFREGPSDLTVWLPTEDTWHEFPLTGSAAKAFTSILPNPFRIQSDVALPDSVPFSWLVSGDARGDHSSRRARASLLDGLKPLAAFVGADHTSIQSNAVSIFGILKPVVQELGHAPDPEENHQSLELARSLLLDLARIDPEAIRELAEAIADGQEGYANALVERINEQLERSLNFRRWWVQDRDFSLRVAPREHDLVFTIRDRTGTEYTFAERSSGLKYFLSYLIQSQADRAEPHDRILLMDEPDTYLSAEAQQDLMRILRDLADDQPDRPAIQVVYVTHSPFLIDKNHAERIRVLEKGRGRDGTLVVDNAAQNHYEPLRSAFGSYVGETAFVGSVNLLVEGITEQVLLAGASRSIRKIGARENEALDLNSIVIVPSGSASHVPYMVHLVRGRDAEKPPVVVLLDSDSAGDEAVKVLKRKPLSSLLSSDLVLQLGKVQQDVEGVAEIEDLIPERLAAAAANACLQELALYRAGKATTITAADLGSKEASGGLFGRLESALAAKEARIEKLPFARAVVKLCEDRGELSADIDLYLDRMRRVFEQLNKMRRRAEGQAGRDRLSHLVDREQQLFVRDHPRTATRDDVANLLEKVEALLDGSVEGDAIQRSIQQMRRDHRLDDEPSRSIEDMSRLVSELEALKDALKIERLVTSETTGSSARGTAPQTTVAPDDILGDDSGGA